MRHCVWIAAVGIGLFIGAEVFGEPGAFNREELMTPEHLVFAEDFTDAASVDRFVFASPNHWKRVKVGDRYALEHTDAGSAYTPPHRSPHNIALLRTRQFGSFILEYEAQQTGKSYGHRDACVFFNFMDPANYYYTHIATKRDPHAHQIFIVDDAPRTMITQQGTSGFDWKTTDSWHRIRVVRDLAAGRITVYVDDMSAPIMEATNNVHGMGSIGFGSFDDSGRVTNIRVYSNDSIQRETSF